MAQPMKTVDETAIEDSVIDETFRNVVSPIEVHRLGREDITENRPGDVLVQAVTSFAAKGGFNRADGKTVADDVNVSIDANGRMGLDDAHEVALGANAEIKTSDIAE